MQLYFIVVEDFEHLYRGPFESFAHAKRAADHDDNQGFFVKVFAITSQALVLVATRTEYGEWSPVKPLADLIRDTLKREGGR